MCGDGFFNFHPFHPLIITSLLQHILSSETAKPMRCNGDDDDGEEVDEYTN